MKPIDAVPLFRCLDKAADRFAELQKKAVAIKLPGSVRIIPVHNICYAERVRRLICYHLIDHSVISSATFNGTFQNAVAPLLEHKEFLLVGSSFVVNLRHVTEITRAYPQRESQNFNSSREIRNIQNKMVRLLAEWRRITCCLNKIYPIWYLRSL